MVITLDFESSNSGSIPDKTYFIRMLRFKKKLTLV